MKQNRMKKGRIATVALLGALGAAFTVPVPAHAAAEKAALKRAESEIAALKQELAEQRALINKLLATQSNQKATIDKIETRTAQAPAPVPAQTQAQVSTQAPAQTPAQAVNSILPKGLSLYGTMDVNVANTDSGHGRKFTVGSAGMTASSIGIKGQKEVRSGFSVIGEVEMGVDLSTGVAGNGPGGTIGENNTAVSSGGLNGTGNQIFSRQAYAGLASDTFGKLTLGRQYSGSYLVAAAESNAFGPGFYGSSATFLPVIGGMPTRLNNSIVYRTPSWNGFSAHATYTAGSEHNLDNANIVSGSGTTDSSGEGYDLALYYRFKGLTTALTGWTVKNASYKADGGETGLATKRGWQAAVSYDFGFAKLFGHYVSGEYSGGNYEKVTKTLSDADGWSVSAKVPFGNHAFIASYTGLDDKSLLDQDASLFGIAYTYKLFDATWLYVSWGEMFNSGKAKYSLLNGGDLVGNIVQAGYNPDGIMMGLNTKF